MACSAVAAGSGLLTTIFGSVDSVGCNYVQNAYQGLSQSLTLGGGTSVAGLLLTLYVMFWGYGIWAGTASGGPTDHAWRLLRVFAIYALATQWSDFQSYAYDFMNDGPSAIGSSLLAASSANNTGNVQNLSTVNGVENALQNIWDVSVAGSVSYTKAGGILNYGGYIVAAVLLVVMAIFVGFAGFLIILAKIFMWLLLSLAPIFIFMLLFGFTSRFFMGWLSALVQYFFVQVLVFAFLAFYVIMTQSVFDRLNQAQSAAASMTEVAPILVVGVIGILLLSQINQVASALSGGVATAAPRLGHAFAKARSAQLAARNPFNPASISRADMSAARLQARRTTASRAYLERPEFQRIRDQIKMPPA